MNYTEELWKKIEEEEQRIEQSKLLIKTQSQEKKIGFTEFLRDMFCGLGVKNVFNGVYDVLLIALMVAAGLFLYVCFGNLQIEDNNKIYGIVFAFSPVVYFVFFLLSVIKDFESGDYNIKMTCRYTAFHLCAFRMFVTGICCLIINAALTAVLAERFYKVFWELFAVSFSSLFIFALLFIISLLRGGIKMCVIPIGFFAVSLVLCNFDWYAGFIKAVPTAAYITTGIIAALFFQKILINIDRRYSYAVR